jgi:hypothetical protein
VFQKRYDTDVIHWLRAQGFEEMQEFPHAVWVELCSKRSVACPQVGQMDPALAIGRVWKYLMGTSPAPWRSHYFIYRLTRC